MLNYLCLCSCIVPFSLLKLLFMDIVILFSVSDLKTWKVCGNKHFCCTDRLIIKNPRFEESFHFSNIQPKTPIYLQSNTGTILSWMFSSLFECEALYHVEIGEFQRNCSKLQKNDKLWQNLFFYWNPSTHTEERNFGVHWIPHIIAF